LPPDAGEESMDNAVRVKFGMAAARELEIEVDASTDVAAEVERALGNGAVMYWVVDLGGHRHGVVLSQVAFLEIEPQTPRDVGFGS
jgi:hypothetical protein